MNNLITIAGDKLQLPPAANEGAKRLFGKLQRLPQHLPRDVVPAQFVMAVTAEANRVPRDVDAGSIVAAAFNCAVVGLLPGPQLGHAHFVPFKRKRGARVCQLIIGYKGYLELAYGSGFLAAVQPEVVLRGEEFERWNSADGAHLVHKMAIDRELVWSNVEGAYCTWQSTAGGGDVAVVGRKELEILKRRGNVWDDNPIAMSKKTAILRARKLWKVTGQMADATYLDELAERGEAQPLLRGGEPEDEPTPSLTEFDAKPQAEPDASRLDWALYEAKLADAFGIGTVDAILDGFMGSPGFVAAYKDRAKGLATRRQEEIRASRGPRSNKPEPESTSTKFGSEADLAATFAAKLRATKDVEEMWAEIEADPAFERLSDDVRAGLAKERDKIAARRRS